MPIDFPNFPILNQEFTASGKTWKWNGFAWDAITLTPTGATGATGPQGTPGGATGATGLGYNLTSNTNNTIGFGLKTFTVSSSNTSTAFGLANRIRVSMASNPSNWMEGVITSFFGTTLIVNVDFIFGSGDSNLWTFEVSGQPGATGVTGSTGATGATGFGATGATGPAVDTSTFVQKSGDTMTGKLIAAANATESKLNIGNALSANPTTTADGDVWMSSANRPAWRSNSTIYTAAAVNLANSFTSNQAIGVSTAAPALRVTQTGTGEAFRVEDESPDTTPFVVSASGRVGIGVTPDASVCLSLDSTGVKFADGTIQTTATMPPLRGQISKITFSNITASSTYASMGIIGILDASTANGMELGTTDTFSLKNISGDTRIFKIFGRMDVTMSTSQTIGIILAKNGNVINETECTVRITTNLTVEEPLITSWIITMNPNDEVSLFVKRLGGSSISCNRAMLVASSVD